MGGRREGTGFEFEFVMLVGVSLILASSCDSRRTLDFSDNFVGGSVT